ncbi:hypothetical protein DPF15_08150, partial [Salmonella enterica subsp. enterica serovar Lattenkamp]|nr:hypothetical protein [Salmonella enterica subsp. enterica serovar Lattenkamp]
KNNTRQLTPFQTLIIFSIIFQRKKTIRFQMVMVFNETPKVILEIYLYVSQRFKKKYHDIY